MKLSGAKDQSYMRLAIKEARKGLGRTSPNPSVGAVIVKDNEVVARGYHKKAGTPHAEINALAAAGELAKGATMYVTLEPCNHFGRTPPCSQALVKAGIDRVVVGMLDPNPLVAGSGIAHLKEHGISTMTGILEEDCHDLNRPFIKYITRSIPWVILKAGVSLDGKLSFVRGRGGAVTGPESHRAVHRLRNRVDAILIGRSTQEIDNPSLTTRLPGRKGRDPVRVFLDSNLIISESAKILHLTSEAPTILFTQKNVDAKKVARLVAQGVQVEMVPVDSGGGLSLKSVLRNLGERGITSVLVEGGSRVHGSFLRYHLIDEVQLFYAPVFAGDNGVSLLSGLSVDGGRKDAITLERIKVRRYGDDVMISGLISTDRH